VLAGGKCESQKLCFGTIHQYAPASRTVEGINLWYVKYDDSNDRRNGELEDLDIDELLEGLEIYSRHKGEDTTTGIPRSNSSDCGKGGRDDNDEKRDDE